MNPERRRLRLGRSLVGGVLIAASSAVTACGSSASPTAVRAGGSAAPTILDTEKVERAIERASLAQRGTHAQVSCPSGVHQKKGLVFSCTAVVESGSTRFVVTELDGAGQVHYEAR